MKKTRLALGLALVALIAAPAVAIAQSGDAEQGDISVNSWRLDELEPAVQYKVDYSEAENAEKGEWYAAHGIAYSWVEEEGMSRTVFPDDWNAEAEAASIAYNEQYVHVPYAEDDVAAVNDEVATMVAALQEAGVPVHSYLDEEGFANLEFDIASDDSNSLALWDLANEVIASLGN